jgi:hypothetical protein
VRLPATRHGAAATKGEPYECIGRSGYQHRSVATALVAGWLVLVAELTAMFFVIPHKGGFAPELGSSGTFVVVAVLYSFIHRRLRRTLDLHTTEPER